MKILIIEDSVALSTSLKVGLSHLGYTVDVALDGDKGLAFALSYDYDVIVLDLKLPRRDGLSVLAAMRREGRHGHILILSARDQVEDRIQGLDAGADDYLVKPFDFEELVARIKVLVRRRYDSKNPAIDLGPVHIDTLAQQVWVDGTELALAPAEYRLLEYLALRRGRVLSHEHLLDHLYDADTAVSRNAIEYLVSSLRRKLRTAGAADLVRTRRGAGYTIEAAGR